MKSKLPSEPASRKPEGNRSQHFRLLFENNPLPMWIYDLETLSFLDVNEAAVEQYGYSRDEFLKLRITDIRPPEDAQAVEKHAKAKRPRLQHSGEWRHSKKDGSIIHVEITSHKLTYEGHKAALVTARDISEKKLVQQLLAESEERYRNLVENSLTGVFQTDLQGQILYVNDKVAEIAGFRSAKALISSGSILLRYKDPADREKFIAALKRGGKVNDFEVQLLTRSGKTKWASLSATLKGNVVSGTVDDITSRKKIEESLIASETQYRALVEQLPTVVYINPADDPSSTIFISPQIETMLGYTPAEWLADPKLWTKSLHPQDRRRVLAESDRINSSGEDAGMEYRMIARDGRVIWIRDLVTLVQDAEGEPKFWQGVMIDITEQHQAAHALSESEKRFRALTENASDLIIVIDAHGIISYVSLSLTHLLGYSQEEVSGKAFTDWVHPDELPQAFAALAKRRKFAGSDSVQVQLRVRHRDGSWRLIEGLGKNLLNNPSIRGIVMNCRDVTERKLTEEALRQSEERFRNLYENSTIGIYRTTPDGRILLSNPALVRMLAYASFEELARNNLEKDDNNAGYRRSHFREMIERDGEVRGLESAWKRKDGTILFVRESARLIRDQDGRALYYDGTVEDITEKKQAEESLTASEAELRALFASMPDAIFVFDREGRYLKIAPTNTDILYRPVEELLGKRLHDVFSRQKADEFVERIQEALDKKQTVHFEYALLLGDHITWFSGTASPLTEDSVVWVGRDITARKLAEDAMLASQDLLKDAQRIAHIGSWELDLKNNVLSWSDETYRIFEMDPEAFGATHEAFLDAIHPDDRAMVDQAYTDSIKNKTPYSITHRLLFPDGRIKFVHERCETIYNGIGEPVRSIGTVQDVTERKLANDSLQERLTELSVIYDASQRLQQILTPETLAKELIHLLEKNLNYEYGAILLIDKSSDRMIPFAISDQGRGIEFAEADKEFIASHDLHVGYGITGWVAEHGQSVRLDDINNDSRYYGLRTDVNSELCVPLRIGDRIIGVANVESVKANAFTESDQRLLETIAAQIAIAIQNARLYEDSVRSIAELEALRESGLALAKSLDPREISEQVVSVLAKRLNWHHAALRVRRADSDGVELLAFSQTDSQGRKEKINTGTLMPGKAISKVGQGMAGWVIKHGRTINSGNLQDDPRYYATFPNMISGLYVPIWAGGQTLGCISVESEQPAAFSEADERLLTTLASQAASALENARLYQDALRSAERRQVLHAASQEISQISQDSEQVYTSIHRAATQLMQADAFVISLLDEANRQIEGVYLVDRNGRNPNLQIPLGQGLSSRVILSGESILINDDLENDVAGVHFGSPDAVRSILAVPLRVSGKVIGAISAQSYEANVYGTEDQLLLELLAAQAAIAIQNARLYREALLAAQRRFVLHQVSQEITHINQDSEQLYGAMYQAALRLIPTDMFTIALVNQAENQIDGAYAIDRGVRGPFISFPLNMGIAGRVIETNKTLLIEDYDDPSVTIERVQFSDNQPTRSILAVPLRSGEKVIGSMSVQSYQPGRYTEEDAVLLEMLGTQATVAIENARLFEQVRRRVKEQEALNRASQSLTGSLDLEPLLENILSSARDAIAGAEKGTILLWDKDSNHLRVYTQIGYTDARILELPFHSEKGYSGRAFWENRAILIEDALAEYESPFDESVEEVYTVQSGIVVPLTVKGATIGVIAFDNATKKGAFTKEDLNLLMIFASSAASVIENARLFEETRRRAEEFSSLYETARDISAEQDLNKLLTTIVERAAVLLNVPVSGIYLYDKTRNDVYVAVSQGFESSIGTHLALGEGVAGRVAQTRQLIIIDNYQTWEGRSPQYADSIIRAVLEVPMLYGGELIGVLTVDELNDSERKFTEDDARLLTLFASYASGAVHNARLLDEARRRAAEFEALYQTAAEVSSETDLKVLLNTIIKRAQALSGASGSGVYLFDPERGDLELVAIADPNLSPGIRLAIGEGLSGRVAQVKQPLLVNDYETWENRSLKYEGFSYTAVLGIPMLYNGELLGVLEVYDYHIENNVEPSHMFTEQDINLLSVFANTAAGAVYSARLLDKTRRRLDELAALAQVSSALRTASTRAEMMSVLLDQLMNVLHADGGDLVSSMPGRDDLLIEAACGMDARYAGMWIPPGEGLSRRVLESGEALTLANAQKDPSFFNPDGDEKAYSVILVPLKSQDKTIGAISMARTEKDNVLPAPFLEDDIRLLNAIADMAANAFQRASLHEETTLYAEQLIIINDLGHGLSETLDLPHIYEKLSRAALDLLPDTATIFILLFDSNKRSINAAYGLRAGKVVGAADLPTIPFDESGGQNQSRVILSGTPLIVPNLSEPLNDKKAVMIQSGNEEQAMGSALYVPMKAEGRVIGVLNAKCKYKNRYTSADAELLGLVANTAASAIQNARLFIQLKRRVDQLSALHSVDTAISSTTDLRVSLQSVLENVTRQLKMDAADVLVLNPATLVLQYVAGLGFFTSDITRTALPLGQGQAGRAALERQIVRLPDLTNPGVKFANHKLITDERFASYVGVPLMAKGDVKGVLEIFHRSPLELDDDWTSFLEMLAGQAALAIDNALLFEGLEKVNIELSMAYDATIEGWSQALELRDQETQGHSARVLELALRLAAEMGISGKDLQDIRRGVLLHDIGKMGVPDSILHKPGTLTDEEWKIMRMHPKYAYDMLAPIAYLRKSLDIPYCHHEKWDGSGYPRGLSGETIPLAARTFAIVDVFDALTSNRPYRDAWSKEKTLDYIREQSGIHFDPRLVDIFLKFIKE